jgi:hypothetical protein
MSFQLVEDAWDLAEEARAFGRGRSPPLDPAGYWRELFAGHPRVDAARSAPDDDRAPEQAPERILLAASPYGLRWRPAHGDWIPFRHGPVTLPPLDLPPLDLPPLDPPPLDPPPLDPPLDGMN